MAEDTVKLPGMKKPVNKYLAYGTGAVALYLGITWWRNRNSASTASNAATAATATGPGITTPGNDPFPWDGTYDNPSDPYSMDSSTGMTYGDEGYSGGSGGSGGGGGGGGGSGGPPFSTNADWSNYVISQMQANNPNVNVSALTDALGLYLNGQPVDAAQKTLIFDAIAIAGDPPVSGTNGYPPKVQLNGGKGGGGGAAGYQAVAPGGLRFEQLAANTGVTYSAIQKDNPDLASKYSGKPVPRGTGFWVPAGNNGKHRYAGTPSVNPGGPNRH